MRINANLAAWLFSVASAAALLFSLTALLNALNVSYYLFYVRTFHIVYLSEQLDWVVLVASGTIAALLLLPFGVERYKSAALEILLLAGGYLILQADSSISLLGAVALCLAAALIGFVGVRQLELLGLQARSRLAVALLALFGLVEVAALPHWLLYPFSKDVAIHAADVEFQLFYLPITVVPEVYLLFLFSWALFPILLWKYPKRWVNSIGQRSSGRTGYMLLGLGVALGLLICLFPYFTRTGRLIGVDIDCCYMPNVERTAALGPGAMLKTDRPLFWFLLYLLQVCFGLTPFQLLFVLSPIFTVATAIGSYVLVKVGTGDTFAAGWAAVVSVLIFNTTAAIILDLWTNWLTMIFALFYFAALLKTIQFKGHWLDYGLLSALLSVALLFMHPYTWEVIMVVTVLAIVAHAILARRSGRLVSYANLSYIGILAITNLLAYSYRVSTSGVGSGVGLGVELASLSTYGNEPLTVGTLIPKLLDPAATLQTFWNNFQFFLRLTAIHYVDWLTPLLGLVGMIVLYRLRLRGSFTTLMVAWLFVASGFVIIMGNYAAPYYSQTSYMPFIWRAFFMTPFQVPAGVALARTRGRFGGSLLAFVIILVLLNHALRSLVMSAVF